MAEAFDLVGEAFRDGIRPPRQLSVSEWADRYRILSGKASDEQGPYRTSRTPYMREPMDSLSVGSRLRLVVFMFGSQLGKTEVTLNWLGYVIDHAPAPILLVYPRVPDAKLQVSQRINPMINACPRLRGKVAEPRSRDAANTSEVKEFPGGVLRLTGANSAAGLRAMPARNVVLDEVDEFPEDVEGEGDPVDLVDARQRNFAERRTLMVSSPTDERSSRIAAAYETTDRRVYLVPCPFCSHPQSIAWSRIKWEKDPKTGEDLPETAHLVCESCGAKIEEHHKPKMLAKGFWLARNPEADPTLRGYWLPSTYSPLGWFSWTDMVKTWLRAQGRPAKLKTFVNTALAEVWREKGDAPEWERLFERREHYRIGTVPKGGLILTAGVDVQADRIELEVVAWGRELESWSVNYIVLPGDPAQAAIWIALSRELQVTYPSEGGFQLPIRAMGLDTNYATQDCYRWVRRNPPDRVFAMRGTDDKAALIMFSKAVEVQHQGKRLQRGIKLWHVGGPVAKSELYSSLRLPKPTEPGIPYPPGFCHFPEYGDHFFKMLTAEEVRPETNRWGYKVWKWTKVRERNEALDCRVYARAAAAILGIDRFTPAVWEQLEANLGAAAPAPGAAPQAPPKPKAEGGGGYLDRWQ